MHRLAPAAGGAAVAAGELAEVPDQFRVVLRVGSGNIFPARMAQVGTGFRG